MRPDEELVPGRIFPLFMDKEIAEIVGAHFEDIRKCFDLFGQICSDSVLVAGNAAEGAEFLDIFHAPHLLR